MSNPLFFSHITLRDSAPISTLRTLMRDGYAPHKTVWQLLSHSPEQKRNFLFRYDIEEKRGLPHFYTLSETKPSEDNALWKVDVAKHTYREFLENLPIRQDSVFRFSLRVNPTFDKSDRTKKQKTRYDLIMHLRHQMTKNEHGQREEPHAVTEHRACKEWLERRQNLGFEVVTPDETLMVEQYDQLRFKHKNNTTIMSRVDISGMLKVTDVAKFQDNLTKGIGHGKAFGCGLLLIRRL